MKEMKDESMSLRSFIYPLFLVRLLLDLALPYLPIYTKLKQIILHHFLFFIQLLQEFCQSHTPILAVPVKVMLKLSFRLSLKCDHSDFIPSISKYGITFN